LKKSLTEHFSTKQTSPMLLIKLLQFSLAVLLTSVSSLSIASERSPILFTSQTLYDKITHSSQRLFIIDVRPQEAYLKGHIPNAINLPVSLFDRSIEGINKFIISPLQFQALVEQAGITSKDHLVIYSGDKLLFATRVFWAFEFYGHQHVSLLDGGYPAWKQAQLPTENEPQSLVHSRYTIELQPQRFASKFNTLMATKMSNTLIIDARPPEEFQGIKTKGKRLGHIPKAQNLAWQEFTLKPPTSLKEAALSQFISRSQIQKKLSILPEKEHIIIYCNGGKESSIIYFGYRLIGKDVSIYDGSWNEWSADHSLPIIQPNL